MKQRLFTLLAALTLCMPTWAYDFKLSNIFYNITSSSAPYTVEVTNGEQQHDLGGTKEYTDSIAIPASVHYNGQMYAVTAIGEKAFHYCEELTQVTIPNSVTTIGRQAFSNCHELLQVTIPNSVTTIEDYAFTNCYSLPAVVIPNSVTTIGNSAFYSNQVLTYVTIGNSVTTIGDNAFFGCTKIIQVTIPQSVATIGENAFKYNFALKHVTMESSTPPTLGNGAFDTISQLVIIVPVGAKPNYLAATTWSHYLIQEVGEMVGELFTATNGDGDTIYYQVTTTNPNTVTVTYGDNPNKGTHSYTDVINIPKTVSYKGETFEVTTIGKQAFSNCPELLQVTIPNSVTTIGDNAFFGCSSLTAIVIPELVTTIGKYAFSYCDALTAITVDVANSHYSSDTAGVLYNYNKETLIQYPIGKSNTSFTTPNSVTTIGEVAFEFCFTLTQVTIGKSVTTIENSAFQYCIGLVQVTCLATSPPTLGQEVFRRVPVATATLSVPEGSIATYQAEEQWKEFGTIQAVSTGITQTATTPAFVQIGSTLQFEQAEAVTVYTISGARIYSGITNTVALPQAGVYIVAAGGVRTKVVVK